MAITITDLPASLPVEPGSVAVATVHVRNDSEIVDEYRFELLGPAAAWATIEPTGVSLLPGTNANITLTFSPPRDAALAPGRLPIGFKVASVERPDSAAVAEGSLDISRFTDVGIEVLPRTSHGRYSGKHEVAIDNRGNAPLDFTLDGKDPDHALGFSFSPPVIHSEPGTATFARLKASHRKRFLRGPVKMRPFEVLAEAEGQPPLTATGQAVQEAMLPRWGLPLLVGLGALALVWAFFLQPKIEDTAQTAANEQVIKVVAGGAAADGNTAPNAGAASNNAGAAAGGGADANSNNPGATTSGSGAAAGNPAAGPGSPAATAAAAAANPAGGGAAGGGGATATSRALAGQPFSHRLSAACPAQCTDAYTVPPGKSLAVIDIILGNPQNSKGLLTLKNGSSIITVENLDNFRDLDFHFGMPVIVGPGQKLTLALTCSKPCSASAFVTGALATQVPKLKVTQAVPDVVDKGDKFDYTIAVTNTGDTALKTVDLSDQIPGELDLSTPDVSRNTFDNCTLGNSKKLTCDIATLNAGDSAFVTLNVSANANGGSTIHYTAVGTSKAPATTNTSKASTKVAQVDLSVAQEGPSTAAVGDLVTYTITVKNDGKDWATNVVLQENLPAGLSNVTANGCEPEAQTVSCSLGPMAPDETRTVVVTGQAATEGTATGTATVTTPTSDSDTGNNTATADTSITPQQ